MEEAELLEVKTQTCEDYARASSQQPAPPDCMCQDSCYDNAPEPEAYESGLSCLASIRDWSADLHQSLSDMKQACHAASQKHEEVVSQCNQDQGLFEAAFCSYRQTLVGSCHGYAVCRPKRLTELEDIRLAV